MTELSKGGNVRIDATAVRAGLSWSAGPGVPDVDASALLLGADGRVSSEADFVFYNQPQHASGSVRHAAKASGTDTLDIDLAQVPPSVDRIVLAASSDGGTFGQVPGLALTVSGQADGAELARFAMSAANETAFISGEFYRRDGGWKFRAIGQGYNSGLAGLATDFGISVESETAPAPAPAPSAVTPATPPPPPPGYVPPAAPPPPPTGVIPPAAPSPGHVPPPSPSPGSVPSPAPPQPTDPATLDSGRISLVKSQRVSLVKSGAPPLSRVVMGLGWDPAPGKRAIDLDASVIAFDGGGRKLEIVWFMHLKEFKGAIVHTGDNLTGKGEGDDEQIKVDLSALPPNVASLVFTINSFKGQKFTEVSRAFCRLVDEQSGQELVRYDLSDSEPASGVLMAMLRRTPTGVWEMRAIGEFHDGRTVKKLVDPAAVHARQP